MNTSIKPGQIWRDTEGKPIQAHGFSVFYKDGLYYWYGENKEFTKPFGKVWTWGIRCYTSADLYNWEDRGLIIPPETEDRQSPMHPTNCIDRPHIIYCEKTGKYVAWIKIMAGLTSQFMCVMQADDFFGPYEYVHKYYHPLGMDTGDFTLVRDGETAYLIFERPHFQLITATLDETYTGVTGEYTAHFSGLYPPYTREAPVCFERNGKHYLFTSGTTGYFPNPSRAACFDRFHGKYQDLGILHPDDGTNTSFNSQISCVLKVPDSGLYIALADRWQPGPKTALMQKVVSAHFRKMFRDYTPDESPRKTERLPDEQITHYENTRDSRYVWLPVEWQGDTPVIRWHREWRIEDYL